MSIEVFINFQGNCREAVEYYAKVFGTEKPKFMTFGEMPSSPGEPPSDEIKALVAYSGLKIAGSSMMFSDTPPGMPFIKGNNITLTYGSKDKEEIKAAFNKLKEGGTVSMDLQETFWSELYGMVTDKFGIPWQFSHDSGRVF